MQVVDLYVQSIVQLTVILTNVYARDDISKS